MQKQDIAELRRNILLSLGHVNDQVITFWEKKSLVKLIITL